VNTVIEPDDDLTPLEYEEWDWLWDYENAYMTVQFVALGMKASICPVCASYCGPSAVEEADPSVGILEPMWYCYCKEHGDFVTYLDGEQEVM
jgi:Pyruvate/2-oxoacid:ferredoxin oxidoreductase delta subunit